MLFLFESNSLKLFLWTLLIGSSFYYNFSQEQQKVIRHARIDALASYKKDILYRSWSAKHGGTYVPITKETPPTPYLTYIKERDIQTPSGKKLTLITPDYMTRQVNELAKSMKIETQSHVTSLKPLRPENAPDQWERKALLAFESGSSEISEVTTIDNQKYLRFMRPYIVKSDCLKCHAHQGYKIGDIRGGISVNVNLHSFQQMANVTILRFFTIHTVVWCLGVFFGVANGRMRAQKETEIQNINASLLEKAQELEVQYENLQHVHKQLKEMHNQNVDSCKYVSVSLLASHAVEEINLPLQLIKEQGHKIENALKNNLTKIDPGVQKLLKIHNDEVEKVSAVISGLEFLTHPDTDSSESVDVHKVLRDALTVMKHILNRENIQVRTNFHPILPLIHSNAGKLRHIFINLLNYAKAAIKEGSQPGLINIRTKLDSGLIMIVISYNGSEQESPQGTRMVLSIVQALMRSLEGNIEIEKTKDKGNRVTLTFQS